MEEHNVETLVYNAAMAPLGPLATVSIDVLDRTLAVNCRTLTLVAQAFCALRAGKGQAGSDPKDVPKGQGLIVVSSFAGEYGSQVTGLYGATKSFQTRLAEALFFEYRGRVAVLGIVCGPIDTPGMQTSKPVNLSLADPDDVAREALANLGKRPVHVVTRKMRLAAWLFSVFLSRATAAGFVNRQTCSTYPHLAKE